VQRPQEVVVPSASRGPKAPERLLVPLLVSKVNPSSSKLFSFKTSNRWLPGTRTKVRCRAMPFVTRSGTVSSNAVCYWVCSSAQWFASVVATVRGRLLTRMRRRTNHGKWRDRHDLVSRIAAYYVITYNESLLTRMMECLKRSPSCARKLLEKYVSRMDANNRLLYGQLLLSSLWLKSRGSPPRAQSIKTTFCPEYRNFTSGSFDTRRRISIRLDIKADPWIRHDTGHLNHW